MNRRVLLVEDDRNILSSLESYLSNEGFSIVTADCIATARKMMGLDPEIIVLDWMLPDGQGLDYLKELRSLGFKLPIILLSARSELVDKVLGLESGADDYLTKPFEPRELVTRMRVRLRDNSIKSSNCIRYLSIEVNSELREAKYKGIALDLTKLEFDLLKLLIESPGRVFTRESILNKVWGFENFPTTRTVDNHIVQLRQKTDADLFETVRGVGYRIVAVKK